MDNNDFNNNNMGNYPPQPAQYQAPQNQHPYYNYQTQGSEYSMRREAPAPPVPPNAQEPKKKSSPLKIVALLLACALFGIIGGVAGASIRMNMSNDNKTVVYKMPEDANQAQGVTKAEDFSVTSIAGKAKASVVSITTENMATGGGEYFFGTEERVQSGAGSGVIISEDGTIITNNHVIEGARNITVTLADGTDLEATLVGRDVASDIAVIKVAAEGLTAARMANSDEIKVGEFCIAVGNPMGTLGGTVTEGIVSAINREIVIDVYAMELLQISAAVSPGNSGGGLFNAKGELIGIVNAKSGGEGAEGLGFAIPINSAMRVSDDLMTHGQVTRAGMNIIAETFPTDAAASQAGVIDGAGLYVGRITKGGAADLAGLKNGDKIVKADGKEISTAQDLTVLLAKKRAGDVIKVEIFRKGEAMEFDVKLQVMEQE